MAVHGVYRGVCVDANDPQKLGRVRVQVPQVMGNNASGWAFPAWSLHDTTIWPEDRLPEPGQGVWVLFESFDRLTWISVFGPVEDSGQLYDLEDFAYETSVSMKLPAMPENKQVNVVGSLIGLLDEIPGPNAVVWFERCATIDGTYTRLSPPAQVRQSDGGWSFPYARVPTEIGWWYRAVFDGKEPFKPSRCEPQQALDPSDPSVLTWDNPAFTWLRPESADGTMTSNGQPCPNCEIGLYVRDTAVSQTWERVASGVTNSAGAWSIPWVRPEAMTQPVEVQCAFLGSDDYDYSDVPEPPKVLPQVVVPTTLTWTPPSITQINQDVTFTGNLTSAYGCPWPNAQVKLETRSPSITTPPAGAWTARATATPDLLTGNWTIPWRAVDASCDYRVTFAGFHVFQSSVTPEMTAVVALNTFPTAPSVPSTIVANQAITATGSVTDQLGRLVRSGTVTLETQQSGRGWTARVTGNVSASGTYSLAYTVNKVGPWDFRIKYNENLNAGYFAGTGPVTARQVGLPVTSMTKGTLTAHSKAQFSWTAISGASQYEVYTKWPGQADWYLGSGNHTDTSFTWAGLSGDTNYTFSVRAKAQDITGAWVYAGMASGITCNLGHGEQRHSGSFGYGGDNFTVHPHAVGSWRPSDGWSWAGNDIYQGSYSSSGWYRGVLQYNGANFRSWVQQNYGGDAVNNLTWNECALFLVRNSSSGNGTGAQYVRLWVTDSTPRAGGEPVLQGGDDTSKYDLGQGGWCYMQPHWGAHVLLNQWVGGRQINSFAVARDVSGSYMKFLLPGGNNCRIWAHCSFNYVTVSYKAPAWV